jgi:type III pantothenate kinase
MILCVDVGNTTTTIGILDGARTEAFWRVVTRERTGDEYAMLLRPLMASVRPEIRPTLAGVCSVVPGETASLAEALMEGLGLEARIVNGTGDSGVEVATADPEEVGGDRIANAAGALYEYGAPVIVIDAGTATTFDYVSPEGRYVGGVIAPGILAGARDLWARARMLPAVEIRKPPSVIGNTTIPCMQSGIFFGALGQIEGIVRRMWEELGMRCPVVLTGGEAALVRDHLGFEVVYDPYLTLKGISYAVDPDLRRGAGRVQL